MQDPSPIITQHALAETDPLCVAAVDFFCEIYGAAAGNMALLSVAIGGVFVGGGIAPRFCPLSRNQTSCAALPTRAASTTSC